MITLGVDGRLRPIRRLKEIVRDAQAIPLQCLKETNQVFLICINTYNSYQLNLGTAPLQYASQFAWVVKRSGYDIFYIHNPHAATLLDFSIGSCR
jgi:hypothetical protein